MNNSIAVIKNCQRNCLRKYASRGGYAAYGAGGALLGGLVGGAIGHNYNKTLLGTLIGGATGAGLGLGGRYLYNRFNKATDAAVPSDNAKKQEEAYASLYNTAKMLNVPVNEGDSPTSIESKIRIMLGNTVTAPTVSWTPEDTQLMHDLLNAEPDLLIKPIDKYTEFIKSLNGKRIIVLPNNNEPR